MMVVAAVALLVGPPAGAREPGAGAGASAGVINPEPPRRPKSSSHAKKHGAHAGKATTRPGKHAGHAGKKSKKKATPHRHPSHHHSSKAR